MTTKTPKCLYGISSPTLACKRPVRFFAEIPGMGVVYSCDDRFHRNKDRHGKLNDTPIELKGKTP